MPDKVQTEINDINIKASDRTRKQNIPIFVLKNKGVEMEWNYIVE